MTRREWVPAAGLALLICVFAALGRLDPRTFAMMLLVPLVLLGLHCRERWSSRSRSPFLATLVVTTAVFAVGLIELVLRNVAIHETRGAGAGTGQERTDM